MCLTPAQHHTHVCLWQLSFHLLSPIWASCYSHKYILHFMSYITVTIFCLSGVVVAFVALTVAWQSLHAVQAEAAPDEGVEEAEVVGRAQRHRQKSWTRSLTPTDRLAEEEGGKRVEEDEILCT